MKAVSVPAASLTGTERGGAWNRRRARALEKENTGGGVSCSHSRSGRSSGPGVKADAESRGGIEPGSRLHRRQLRLTRHPKHHGKRSLFSNDAGKAEWPRGRRMEPGSSSRLPASVGLKWVTDFGPAAVKLL